MKGDLRKIQDMVRNGEIKDAFDDGTVIRWKFQGYTFVALKARVWYTTSSHGYHVDPQPTFAELVYAVSHADATDIEVAGSWLPVDYLG